MVEVIARQWGTAQAFLPVLRELRRRKIPFVLFSYPPCEKLFLAKGVSFHKIAGFSDFMVNAPAQARVLLTGSSLQKEDDAQFFKWARQAGIKSFAFVDNWLNYSKRFLLGSPAKLPDTFLLLDREMKKAFAQLGRSNVRICGLPSFDDLPARRRHPEFNIVFVSEPHFRPGIEKDAKLFKQFLQPLAKVAATYSVELWIKVHPLDDPRRLRALLPDTLARQLCVRVLTQEREKCLQQGDAFVGVSSMLLREAKHLGIATFISSQKKDPASDLKKFLERAYATSRGPARVIKKTKNALKLANLLGVPRRGG